MFRAAPFADKRFLISGCPGSGRITMERFVEPDADYVIRRRRALHRRSDKPDALADMAAFLVGDEVAYIDDKVIAVDGGKARLS
jgi:NAD(P)-dependent dehydrogenase (short-subunit alcohol dehydrogenase family)